MVLGDKAGATCTRISSLDAIRVTSALTQCVDVDVRLFYAAIQNLICGCGNVPQTTAESSDTSPIHSAQHVQQSVRMCAQLPADLQCDPVQMAEVVQQDYVLVDGHGFTIEQT